MPGWTGRESRGPRAGRLGRRGLLALPLLAAAGCASRAEPEPLPSLVSGYRHLTPIRLNVAEVELPEPAPAAIRVDSPATVRPDREMLRMAQERIVPMGTEGRGVFIVQLAEFRRERLAGSGGLFAGEPGERLTCRMNGRLEILSVEGGRVGFVEAEARRQRTVPDGSTPAARSRAAEEVVRQAMDDMNVEFEFQIRRALRAWLVEGAAPPPAAPLGPGGIEREDLPRG
jgi:hypothetical protein